MIINHLLQETKFISDIQPSSDQREFGLIKAVPGINRCPFKIDKNEDSSYGKEIPYHESLFQMVVSKLTSKSQTTIPQSVRRALDMRPGDILEYKIADGKVILTKALKNNKTDDPFRTFDEWNSEADEHAYGDL